MDMSAYREEIKLRLTGYVLDLELDDGTLDKIINSAFREVQRYIDTTRLATIPYKGCIDLSEVPVSSVSRVFRTVGNVGGAETGSSMADPVYAAQWQILAGSGNGMYLNNWAYDYAAWNTSLQLRNSLSTDLLFRFDKHTNRLYINCANNKPDYITIEYVPRYNDVSEIVSDYWIDILTRLSVALTKVTLGRIRTRYTQSNALWAQDGERLLEEGQAELDALREQLVANSQLVYPID